MENGPPLVLWQEIDEEFHVKETGRVRAIVRTSYLVYDLWHFRKRGQDLPGTVRNLSALGRSRTGSQGSAHPDCTFIQVRQEFRTNHSAEGEKARNHKEDHSCSNRNPTMANGPSDIFPIRTGQEFHHRVLPLLGASPEQIGR